MNAGVKPRFRLYASFVKVIEIEFSSWPSSDASDMLRSRPLSRILPNIHNITIRFHDMVGALPQRLFNSPPRALHFDLTNSLRKTSYEHSVSTFVKLLKTQGGNDLRAISYKGKSDWTAEVDNVDAINDDLLAAIAPDGEPLLHTLALWYLQIHPHELLLVLGAHPCLRSFSYRHNLPLSTSIDLPPNSFPVLRHLEATFADPHSLDKFLSCVPGSQLERMTLEVVYVQPVIETVTLDLHRFTSLREIRLDVRYRSISWNTFRSLLSCTDVESVAIHMRGAGALLDNEKIKLVAQSWRGLRLLVISDFGVFSRDDPIPGITLDALTCLAESCHRLEVLELRVDARSTAFDSSSAIGTSVQILNLGRSSVLGVSEAEETNAAGFIARMWPNHRKEPAAVLDDIANAYGANFGGHTLRTHIEGQFTLEGPTWSRIWRKVDALLDR